MRHRSSRSSRREAPAALVLLAALLTGACSSVASPAGIPPRGAEVTPTRGSIPLAALGATPAGAVPPTAAAAASARPDPSRAAALNESLLAATRRNDVATVRTLIAAGADVDLKDGTNEGAFLIAAADGHLEIVRLALAAGADDWSTGAFGGTALTPAAHHGHLAVVRLLLTTKVPVDQNNGLGWTALLEAVILGEGGPTHVEIVRALLGAGAMVNLADRFGVTPLGHARARGQSAMASVLERAGGR